VTHLWSLSVEEQFYLTWPFVVLRTSLGHLARVCVAMIVVALLTRLVLALLTTNAARVGTPTPASFDALAIGALLAWHHHVAPAASAARARALRWCLVVGSGLLVGAIVWRWLDRQYVLQMTTENLGVPLVAVWVVARCAEGRAWRALAWGPIRYLGTISYGIYLWHMPVIWAIRQLVRDDPALRAAAAGSVAMLVCVSVVTVAIATLSWYALERPINRLKRRFPYPIAASPA